MYVHFVEDLNSVQIVLARASVDSFVGFITSDRVQGALGFYLESLKKKSKV